MYTLSALIFLGVNLYAFMLLIYLFALMREDNSLVDTWSPVAVVYAIIVLFFTYGADGILHLLTFVMVLVWGIQAGARELLKPGKKGETAHYVALRKKWRQKGNMHLVWKSYFTVFLLRTAVLWLLLLPAVFIISGSVYHFTTLTVIGFVVWTLGLYFEVSGNTSLDNFRRNKNNERRVLTKGVFYYTRRPALFGQVVMVWGIWILALSVPLGWVSIISPLLATYCAYHVSGPKVEKRWSHSIAYRRYRKVTNHIFPWFPKTRRRIF